MVFFFLAELGLRHCTRALSLFVASGGHSPLRCAGLSLRWPCRAQAPGTWASVVVARRLSSCDSQALECRLSTCGSRAQPLRGMWDLPGPGLEPVSPALAGGLPTTAPPGKSLLLLLSLASLLFFHFKN